MLAPHELKNKTFTKSVRGYNSIEVDEYIEFLIEKYTEIYRENNELERKLKMVASKLDEIRDEEESIRNTLLNAQKMGERIIKDASERADSITNSIKERCDAIISDFKNQIKEEKDEMWQIRTHILDFKKNIFDSYRLHIEALQSISVNEIEEIILPDESKIIEDIITDVKTELKKEIKPSDEASEQNEPIQNTEALGHFSNEANPALISETDKEEPISNEQIPAVEEKDEEPIQNSGEDDFIAAFESTQDKNK